MKELYPLFGVVAIPQTPFDEDGRVDMESLARSLEDRINAGVSGMLVPVVASEVSRLTTAERHAIVRATVAQVPRSIPVIVGCSSEDPREARAMAEFAVSEGAAGVLVQVPFPIIRDEPAVLDFFGAVCEADPPMLMIQDLEWGAPGLPVDTIVRLFEEVDAFRCIKVETVPAGSKYTAILEATGHRLNVSGGWAIPQLIEALDRGVHAIMPGGLHWPLVEIMRRYAAGERDSARALFDRLLPILGWQNQHIDISNQFLKLLAVRQGIYRTARLRDPGLPYDAYHHRIAAELIEDAIVLHEELGWRPVGQP
ncbi:MAG: dihydrodipicolinate synthase family protein [Chloroflexi bacterium]|nr:dihydrodipicolinate synthase family protein [Chloroflexota bacterium]